EYHLHTCNSLRSLHPTSYLLINKDSIAALSTSLFTTRSPLYWSAFYRLLLSQLDAKRWQKWIAS
ncbi:hypothetical protein, partial [Aeromonas dhakensis]|uniref:hypothetical protein n=1 Tax=Aeromonas dhakensis TaxID=196024 RepID=UPI001956A762